MHEKQLHLPMDNTTDEYQVVSVLLIRLIIFSIGFHNFRDYVRFTSEAGKKIVNDSNSSPHVTVNAVSCVLSLLL